MPGEVTDLVLNSQGREYVRVLLKVAKDAVYHLPRECVSVLYGTKRDLRYELRQAVENLEDHLDREGEAF